MHQLKFEPSTAAFGAAHQRKHPDSLLLASNGEKMSEVIQDFAEPLLDGADSPEEVKKALVIAMVAWNHSLLQEAGEPGLGGIKSDLLADPTVRGVFESLVERKWALYPDNRRFILDYELIPSGHEYRFNVISTLGSPVGKDVRSSLPRKADSV